jgi:prepilin-type N-terminal cleavage/methylation domain-containing protein
MNIDAKGFTFLELIVSLFIISLIAAIVLPTFAGFDNGRLKSEVREVSSILRSVYDSAISRKETYWVTFDLDGNLISWKTPEGTRAKGFDNVTAITTLSKGTISNGGLTLVIEPLGPREDISVDMGLKDEKLTITLNHLSGKVKIKEKL